MAYSVRRVVVCCIAVSFMLGHYLPDAFGDGASPWFVSGVAVVSAVLVWCFACAFGSKAIREKIVPYFLIILAGMAFLPGIASNVFTQTI